MDGAPNPNPSPPLNPSPPPLLLLPRSPRHERRCGGPRPIQERHRVRLRLRRRVLRQGYARRLLPRLRRVQALPLGAPPREQRQGA
ncbi:hypothetical protein Tsubulata_000188, partial [Turnera subulata]